MRVRIRADRQLPSWRKKQIAVNLIWSAKLRRLVIAGSLAKVRRFLLHLR
jgi:hypothetical protein